nr:immunoglobulin heavy chain junction region [Mus musculus]
CARGGYYYGSSYEAYW